MHADVFVEIIHRAGRVRIAKPDEQKFQNREAVLRGLFERAVCAREFRSSIARDAGRVREQARDRPLRFPAQSLIPTY